MLFGRSPQMVAPEQALPGRTEQMPIPEAHHVNASRLTPPWPHGISTAVFALGCFWGAERVFWQLPGVVTTAVGYTAGFTPNPTYNEVCTGSTGHTEAVLVVSDSTAITFEQLLQVFWESHDPTQGFRQGNDVGTQYRSGIYTADEDQLSLATASRDLYQTALDRSGYGRITTEIEPLSHFYYAEAYHQQYLSKNPGGYCGLGGTGVSCQGGIDAAGKTRRPDR